MNTSINRFATRACLPVALCAFLVAVMVSCATTNTAPTVPAHPNQINAFDGAAYDTLITVQASINQAKTLIVTFPQFKADLNAVISGYNAAQAAYKIYHTTGAGGVVDTTTLQTQLTALVTQVAALLKNLGVAV